MRAPLKLSMLGPCLLAIAAIGPTTAARAQEVIDNATVSVPGDEPNPWNVGDDIIVGDTGTGILNITAGGVVLSASGTLGNGVGSSGTVNATGLGALWDLNNEYMYVGNDGTGTLLISEGAHVENVYSTYIAYGASSTGTVTVTGGFSQLIMPNDIFVGQRGSGTLNVTAGGYVYSANDAWIGAQAGAIGEATVTGRNSLWEVGAELVVGSRGEGTLTVAEGGSVSTAGYFYAGYFAGSSGEVAVSGANSEIHVVSGAYIGYSGTGSLLVSDGGLFRVDNDFTVGNSNVGTATITGTDSELRVGTDAYIGYAATGSLVVSDGALFQVAGMSIIGDGGAGSVTVTGAGSLWTAGHIDVGAYLSSSYPDGRGDILVENGGAIDASSMTLSTNSSNPGAPGTLVVTGAGSSVTLASNLVVGEYGPGTLDVLNGGRVESGYGYIGYEAGSVGTAHVSGVGSQWIANSDLYIGYEGAGTLNITGGAYVSGESGYLGYSGADASGTLLISGPGSELYLSGSAEIGYEAAGTVIVSNGGLFTVDDSATLGDGGAGKITVSGPGSKWTVGDVEVGVYRNPTSYPDGRGDVIVEAGGAIEATSMHLGFLATSFPNSYPVEGTLLVSGQGSSVTLTGDLIVGNGGDGIATIANGGHVSASAVSIATSGSDGTGTLIFGAAASDPAVAAGTLSAPTVAFGAGSGEIVFNHTSNLTFASAVGGIGAISVLSGTTTFATDSPTFTGDVDVTGGTAVFNADYGGAAVEVSGGGIVGGNGTIVSLDALSGGTVAPGNSPGTIHVIEGTTFAAGSAYAVEVAGAQSDLILTGSAELNGGTVEVSGSPSLMRYTILTSTMVITGTGFDGVDTTSAFILYSLDYDLNNVYLVVDGFNALTTAARTPNQYAVANALDKFPAGNPLYSAIIGGSVADAQQAFNALSGEIHASVGTALADDSRYVREAITGRLIQAYYGGAGAGGGQPIVLAAAAPTDVATIDASSRMSLGAGYGAAREAPAGGHNLAYWSRAFGAWGQYDTNGNAATTDRNLGGFITGVDGDLGGGWRAGLATGYLHTGLSADERLSSASINSYVLGGYAGGALGHGFALRSGGTWTWNDVDSARSVVFPGFFEAENANYNGNVGQLFAELAYPLFTHGGVVEPFAGLAYVHVGTGGFTESGPVAGLTSGGLDMSLGYGTLGARTGTTVVWGGTTVIPHASAAWQYAFGDTTPEQALAFASTGIGMGIGGVPLAQSSALVEVGADALIGPEATLGLSYIGQYSGNFTDSGLRGRFNWKF